MDTIVDIATLKNLLTTDVYARFKLAVELGKWSDGTLLTAAQRESCLQGIILYESQHVAEMDRTAYIPPKPAEACVAHTDHQPIVLR